MWSEEELRDIEPVIRPRQTGAGSLASTLRRDVLTRNQARARFHPHEQTRGASIIYTPGSSTHGNFIESSYRRICANPEWRRRLQKTHTAKRQARLITERDDAWCELDAATSSDALLMNILCYPRVLAGAALTALLGIDRGESPEFGFKPRVPLLRNLTDATEIDCKLGPLLLEAKLTEADFQSAPLCKLERYRDFHSMFDLDLLPQSGSKIASYQLIRGVLAVQALSSAGEEVSYCVLLDARRPDLMESWYAVQRAVRSFTLQSRLRLLTWQELVPTLPSTLSLFLAEKYGITRKLT